MGFHNNEIKIVDYTEIDFNKLAKFLNERVPWVISADILMEEFSYLKSRVIFKVAIYKDEIICTLAMKPFFVYFAGKKVLAGKLEYNQILYPIGKRIYKKLVFALIHESKRKNIKLLYGLTNETIFSIFRKHFRFEIQENSMFLIVLKLASQNKKTISKPIKSVLSYFTIIYLKTILKLNKIRINYKKEIKSYQIKRNLLSPSDINVLNKKKDNRKDKNIQINITEDYLNYLNIVYKSMFYCYYLYRNNKLQGYLIFSLKNNEIILYEINGIHDKLQLSILIFLLDIALTENTKKLYYYSNNKNDNTMKLLKKYKLSSYISSSIKRLNGYFLTYFCNLPINNTDVKQKFKWKINALWLRSIE